MISSKSDYPDIKYYQGFMLDINRDRGLPCLVKLKVKYRSEKNPVSYELWMKPGWESGFLWQEAYRIIRNEQAYTKYKMSDVEEAKFESFKLV